MRGNGKKQTDVLGNPNLKRYDLTDPANYEGDYPDGDFKNNIEKIYEVPGIEDMAGVVIRGIFKSERQLNAIIRLSYRHRKYNDVAHQEMLREKIAGSAAINGVGRLDALQAGVNLLAPDMYRVARDMPKLRKGERETVVRGSDFRNDGRPPEGGLANKE